MKQRTPRGFWNIKENVIAKAKEYNNRTDFIKGSYGAYEAAGRNGWLEESCLHMTQSITARGFWDVKDNLIAEAKRFNNRTDFARGSSGAYEAAIRNNWLGEICSHMIQTYAIRGNWCDKNNVLAEALKYKTRMDFCKGSAGAYDSAFTNGWLDDACTHMSVQGSLAKRFLYKITFPDGAIYIGLTCKPEQRFSDHIKGSSTVNKYMIKTNTQPTFELLNENLYSAEDAADLESLIIDEYRSMGKNIINVKRGGSLGGIYK